LIQKKIKFPNDLLNHSFSVKPKKEKDKKIGRMVTISVEPFKTKGGNKLDKNSENVLNNV